MPDAAPNEAENVEQPKTIVTHRPLEVNPKASAAWMRRLSGHAALAAAPLDLLRLVPRVRRNGLRDRNRLVG